MNRFIKLNRFAGVDFTCDKCKEDFPKGIAYSVASEWNNLGGNYTYCENCLEIEEELSELDTKLRVIRVFSN